MPASALRDAGCRREVRPSPATLRAASPHAAACAGCRNGKSLSLYGTVLEGAWVRA
jgi:hypothetical protein